MIPSRCTRALALLVVAAHVDALRVPHLVRSNVGTLRLPQPVRMAGGGPLALSKPSKEITQRYDVLSWNMAAVGSEPVQESSGVSVFGDATMRVTPSSAELAESLPAGCVRYVFEGSGSVSAGGQSYALEPNTLVEAVEATDVVWTTTSPVMVVASSEYDSPTRVAARAALPFIFGGLAVVGALAAVLSGS